MNEIRKSSSIDLQLLRAVRAKRKKVIQLIQNTEKLIAEYQKLFESESEGKPGQVLDRSQVETYKKKIQELNEKLVAYEADLDARNNPIDNSAEPLQDFDIESIPISIREDYISWLLGYAYSRNKYYVVEIFTRFVKEGINPPKWVLDIIADGFYRHIRDPKREPKSLAQKLGLQGAASGSTNPWQERKLRTERTAAMLDMASLIRNLNVSHIRAAKAVKIKYRLSQSPSTLKKYLLVYFGSATGDVLDPENGIPLSQYDRTKFVSSFPVAARKCFTR